METQNKPYVTIAYSAAMTPPEDEKVEPIESSLVPVQHQLAGAHAAQYRANHQDIVGGPPLIRLVMANQGTGQQQWEYVVSLLEGMTDEPDYLRAVVGMGVSRRETALAAQRLSAKGIAMVGATITSDELSGDRHPGLFRVAPTNSDLAKAGVAFLPPEVRNAMLIEDTNAADSYSRTLADNFRSRFPASRAGRRFVGLPEVYDGSKPGLATRFLQIATTICATDPRPDIVLFAGRGEALTTLLRALGPRPCQGFPIPILSGDDATTVAFDDTEVVSALRGGESAPVRLIYTALAHPEQWRAGASGTQTGAPENFRRFREVFESKFSPAWLSDGDAMMAHDAVLTAARAIRASVDPSKPIPGPDEVLQAFAGLHGSYAVPGATGNIELNPKTGNPISKPVPILQIGPDGSPVFLQRSSPE